MLSPQNRMRQSAEFSRVMRAGRRSGRDGLSVVYLDSSRGSGCDDEPPRVGFIVSKAVGNAVVRNRVQRRLRHLMRERIPFLPAGSLLVVRAKPLAASHGHDTLAAQLDGAIAAAKRPKDRRARGSHKGRRAHE
ncbi:ribonuclease P protein component [Haloactinospora alba]|uniref:Ribonuclease P protein component n=1 Tax=Haloactinospora alba TaxID=405555 RepID=A0A543N9W1_9ACTN|nr:ribonuclease P protein component [Haloactinospora alba]TQN28588.1 ribonuclease P protein component [Haloactinospora alba]